MKTRNVAPCLMVTLFCLIGCTHTFEAKGKTQVYEEVFPTDFDNAHKNRLRTGPATILFGPTPWWYTSITIDGWDFSLSAKVYRDAYLGQSFTVSGEESTLPYNLKVSWTRHNTHLFEQEDRVGCTTPGICSHEVTLLECKSGKSYSSGSKGYHRHEDDERCDKKTRYETGFYSNCPGIRTDLNRYKTSNYTVTVDFMDSKRPQIKLGQFIGETQYMADSIETLREGHCSFSKTAPH
ncbi:hypothetical protein [Pseudomonas sp. MAG002Y]|uniref:hypothetical protein n=1 Tax=Pseudomonas sp. MAG002Y TaxID=2678690 RepID=UPI001C608A59|nr:hypothetical protein [Pseudomonas sp. MAG002Y]MBW5415119.1 hypothetical protein [Pseudomonas sp. MAG002Y]